MSQPPNTIVRPFNEYGDDLSRVLVKLDGIAGLIRELVDMPLVNKFTSEDAKGNVDLYVRPLVVGDEETFVYISFTTVNAPTLKQKLLHGK